VVHVTVSHYAVGGGLFLAVETQFAYKSGNKSYLDYLKQHAWFFILITVVFGAITGVGIWWIIGLASPLATEVLIHSFVFGWAIEYVFFLLEITSAFIFFYFWGKLSSRTHITIGWIYGISAWISLFVITGITAFMLNPGGWVQNREFWIGFFNPQFIPQTLARTGGAFLLASQYVYLHAAFKVKDPQLRNLIESRSTRPALFGAILIILGGIGWYYFLPESARAALTAASVLNLMMMITFVVTAAVFVMLYLGPYKNPGWLSPGFAILFFAFGMAAVSTGEFIREAVRKPYIIYNVVMSNQILPEEIPGLKTIGYLEGGVWTNAWVRENYPQVAVNGILNESAMLNLPESDQLKLGELIFQYHCNDCHSAGPGLSSVEHLTRGWTPDMIYKVVSDLEKAHFFMPPFEGTNEEAIILSKYLTSIAPAHPAGMYYGNGK